VHHVVVLSACKTVGDSGCGSCVGGGDSVCGSDSDGDDSGGSDIIVKSKTTIYHVSV
jgi:hypothetical protein